ncbi:MAG: hypothetical protein IKE52_01075 [Mogibacterium sp.]|nr:hypothetical protein [Mogibacterium sp.]
MTSYVQDIACSKIVSLKDDEGEVWVINKNRFGEMQVSRDFLYEITGDDTKPFREAHPYDTKEQIAEKARNHLTMDDGRSLKGSRSFRTKPCEMDDFLTRRIINRNIEKIRIRGY